MEFSFHYDGPREGTDVRLCPTCASASEERCCATPSHGKREPGCACCDAAVLEICSSHCGLLAALAAARVPPEAQEAFDDFAAFAKKRAESFTGRMRAKFVMHCGLLEANPHEYIVEVFELR